MKRLLFLLWICPTFIYTQNVGIGTTIPDPSAELDIQSTTSGVLIPRLTTSQRGNISNPATGLLIYNSINNGFEYYDGTNWQQIDGGAIDRIRDADGDTFVETRENSTNDYIQLYVEGSHVYSILRNPNGVPQIVPIDNISNSTVIGFLAGNSLSNESQWNVIMGKEAGENQSGDYNVIVGGKAGEEPSSGSENVMVGVRAGQENTGSFNTFIGRDAGKESDTSQSSTFLGYKAGRNATGSQNTFVGQDAGENTSGSGNIGVGYRALPSPLTGTQNVAIGNSAGGNMKTGSLNVIIGNEAGSEEDGDMNTYVGTQSGFVTLGNNNTFLGYQSGENSTGSKNVFLGNRAGRNESDSNKLYIENTDSVDPLIYGDFLADEVKINGDLEVTGSILVDSIDVRQITGVIGSGYSAVIPDVMYNRGDLEIDGVGTFDDILITSSIGIEADTFCTPSGGNCIPELGFNMEFPLVLETADAAYISDLQTWFTNPDARDMSVITNNLQGNEMFRYNLYSYIPDTVEPGTDGRTKFTIKSNVPPNSTFSIEQLTDFGTDLSCSTGDKLVEINGIIINFSPDSIIVNNQTNTIMMDFGFNEGAGLFDWFKDVMEVSVIRRELSIIETNNCSAFGETSRTNYFEVLPFRFEIIYGFGLETKFTGRIFLKYALAEPG